MEPAPIHALVRVLRANSVLPVAAPVVDRPPSAGLGHGAASRPAVPDAESDAENLAGMSPAGFQILANDLRAFPDQYTPEYKAAFAAEAAKRGEGADGGDGGDRGNGGDRGERRAR